MNSFGHMNDAHHVLVSSSNDNDTIDMPNALSEFDNLTSSRTAAPGPAPHTITAESSPIGSWNEFLESDFLINHEDDSDDADSDYDPQKDDHGSQSSGSSHSWSSDSSSLSQSDQSRIGYDITNQSNLADADSDIGLLNSFSIYLILIYY